MRVQWLILALISSFAFAHDALQTKYFYTIPIDKLELIEGERPPAELATALHNDRMIARSRFERQPRFAVALDTPGESELIVETNLDEEPWSHVFLAIALSQRVPVEGTVRWATAVHSKTDRPMEGSFRFRVPANANTTRAENWFSYARAARLARLYARQISHGAPGMAWFRRQLSEVDSYNVNELAFLWEDSRRTAKQVEPNIEPAAMEPNWRNVERIRTTESMVNFNQFRDNWNSDFTELLSGGRALSENLQLNRNLNIRGEQKDYTVQLADLPGITVKEFDWTSLTKDLHPRLDPLASLIPANQHAMFFPSVPAALSLLDEIDRTGLAIFHLSAVESADSRLTQRYMRQLGMPGAELSAMLPPNLVTGVAITGGDLYFDTGTDVAVLLATEQGPLIKQLLATMWNKLRAKNPDSVQDAPVISDIQCQSIRTPDRRLCVYLAEFPGAVVIANSPAQIRQLAAVAAGKQEPLSRLAEYTFFRDRYRRGDADETGLAIVTDAAIRRWCSAKWRIGYHRRMLNAAVLADVQAAELPAMVTTTSDRTIDWPGLGPVQVTAHGVLAANIGTREFQTPIGELEIDRVTEAEAEGYGRWRESYQRNWDQFFDPIALRVTAKPERVGIDMTVMPLIEATRYRQLMELSQGAKLPATAGDPHPESMGQFIVGFNRESEAYKKLMKQTQGLLSPQMPIDSWLGDWFTVYVDEDPLWAEFAKFEGQPEEFWKQHQYAVPIAAAVQVRDPLKLAVFLTALKGLVDSAAPNLVDWENIEYRATKYLKIKGRGPGLENTTLYSLPMPDVWVMSPSEAVIKRAVDRYLERKDGAAPSGAAWLGQSAAFHARPYGVQFLAQCWGRWGMESYQEAAWANLPILNEWKRLAPNSDPVAFHEKWWGERLLDPAGGTYVWNYEDATMESSVFGSPGRPKKAVALLPAALRDVREAKGGVTFEMNGLRARIELTRDAK